MEFKFRKNSELLLHILVWAVLFLSPLMTKSGERMSLTEYLFSLLGLASLFLVFYINYFILAPRWFMTKKKRPQFFIVNAVLISCLTLSSHYWFDYYRNNLDPERNDRKTEQVHRRPSVISFLFRDALNLALAATTATAIVMSKRWSSIEKAQQEAENARVEAELKNLRSQINPHFLLNTLNNIYALTAFDSEKAQGAIMELSGLLRHVLYDNQQEFVKLTDEVSFIDSYVKLMKIRLTSNVTVTENVDIDEHCSAMIAPLIFISLIENAFKHGISPTEKSFININISATNDDITCSIENSNHPKDNGDRSGHGIGLKQVERRLQISYPGKYTWEKGINNNIYFSKIVIFDTHSELSTKEA